MFTHHWQIFFGFTVNSHKLKLNLSDNSELFFTQTDSSVDQLASRRSRLVKSHAKGQDSNAVDNKLIWVEEQVNLDVSAARVATSFGQKTTSLVVNDRLVVIPTLRPLDQPDQQTHDI